MSVKLDVVSIAVGGAAVIGLALVLQALAVIPLGMAVVAGLGLGFFIPIALGLLSVGSDWLNTTLRRHRLA